MTARDALLGVLALVLLVAAGLDYYRARRASRRSIGLLALGLLLAALGLRRRPRAPAPVSVPAVLPVDRTIARINAEADAAGREAQEAQARPSALGADEVAQGLARHVRHDGGDHAP